MLFSLGYPIIGLDPRAEFLTADAVTRISQAAEAAGFSAVSFTEHPAPPSSWRDGNGHDALDPFVALAFAAACTTKLRLLTFLTVVPYRNPFLLAKTTASLDRLSAGRLILGVGAGYLREEFEALGVDFDVRNALFDEALDVLRLAWTGHPVEYQGHGFRAPATVSRPTPVQLPHPPLWLGGNASRTRQRVAEMASGWMPIPTSGAQSRRRSTAALESVEQLSMLIAEIHAERERLGRLGSLDVKYLVEGIDPCREPERYCDQVRRLASAGITWIGHGPEAESVAQAIERIDDFGENVIRSLAEPGDLATDEPPNVVDRSEEEAIIRLRHRYASMIDRKQFDRMGEIFVSDVVVDYGTDATLTGLGALRSFMANAHAEVDQSCHAIVDYEIQIEGEHAWFMSSERTTLWQSGTEAARNIVVGRYVDELVRTTEGWRITRHTFQRH